MKQKTFTLRMFLSVALLSAMVVGPAAVPIITPPTLRTIIACQGQTTGMIVVTDSRGRTYTQACDADLRSAPGYPGLFPTVEAPWQVTIIVLPVSLRARWLTVCHSQIISAPNHVQCATTGPAALTVDFYMILGF
jgi:hypothetical protein